MSRNGVRLMARTKRKAMNKVKSYCVAKVLKNANARGSSNGAAAAAPPGGRGSGDSADCESPATTPSRGMASMKPRPSLVITHFDDPHLIQIIEPSMMSDGADGTSGGGAACDDQTLPYHNVDMSAAIAAAKRSQYKDDMPNSSPCWNSHTIQLLAIILPVSFLFLIGFSLVQWWAESKGYLRWSQSISAITFLLGVFVVLATVIFIVRIICDNSMFQWCYSSSMDNQPSLWDSDQYDAPYETPILHPDQRYLLHQQHQHQHRSSGGLLSHSHHHHGASPSSSRKQYTQPHVQPPPGSTSSHHNSLSYQNFSARDSPKRTTLV